MRTSEARNRLKEETMIGINIREALGDDDGEGALEEAEELLINEVACWKGWGDMSADWYGLAEEILNGDI